MRGITPSYRKNRRSYPASGPGHNEMDSRRVRRVRRGNKSLVMYIADIKLAFAGMAKFFILRTLRTLREYSCYLTLAG